MKKVSILQLAALVRSPVLRSLLATLLASRVLPEGVVSRMLQLRHVLLVWIPIVLTVLSQITTFLPADPVLVGSLAAVSLLLNAVWSALSPASVQQPRGALDHSVILYSDTVDVLVEDDDVDHDDYEGCDDPPESAGPAESYGPFTQTE